MVVLMLITMIAVGAPFLPFPILKAYIWKIGILSMLLSVLLQKEH
jgi:hypothetical protein